MDIVALLTAIATAQTEFNKVLQTIEGQKLLSIANNDLVLIHKALSDIATWAKATFQPPQASH